jgi:hypothetical protein
MSATERLYSSTTNAPTAYSAKPTSYGSLLTSVAGLPPAAANTGKKQRVGSQRQQTTDSPTTRETYSVSKDQLAQSRPALLALTLPSLRAQRASSVVHGAEPLKRQTQALGGRADLGDRLRVELRLSAVNHPARVPAPRRVATHVVHEDVAAMGGGLTEQHVL